MRPRIWEDEDPSGSSPQDILESERERRGRRRRGLRALLPGYWLTGRFGVAVLCLFIAGGVGWIGFQKFVSSDRLEAAPVSRADRHPESGRDLTVSEYSMAVRFGEPLRLGSGGLPVVRVLGTGEERELTPLEMETDAAYSLRASPRGTVIEVPGPRGWGMWWLDRSEQNLLRPRLSFDRLSWVEKQEDELVRLTRGVRWGVWIVSQLDLKVWKRGAGEPMLGLLAEIRRTYPPAQRGHWSAVPGLWACDLQLEMDLHQGLTPGCPGDEYKDVLGEAWARGGMVVDRLERIARMVERMDQSGAADLYRSTMQSSLAYEIMDLSDDIDDFDSSLAELRRVSHDWNLYIHADLMGGRP